MIDRLSVTVAVLTYRRPDDLAELLPILVAESARIEHHVEVLVVDNDPEASAAALVSEFGAVSVRYVHEPTPGIAAARNRALDEAPSANILVFIDDDERPVDGWLALLLETWMHRRPVGVVGPVVSRFSQQPESWIREGRFFERRRLQTGTLLEVAATNNLLLNLDRLRELAIRFDERFGLSGGSDTLFTRDIVRRGGELVWCDEAVVFDIVPPSRLSREWVLQRAYRSGNSWSRTTLALAETRKDRALSRLSLTARGAVRLAGGLGAAAGGSILHSEARHAGGMRTAKRGSGMLSGAWGHVYSEYERV